VLQQSKTMVDKEKLTEKKKAVQSSHFWSFFIMLYTIQSLGSHLHESPVKSQVFHRILHDSITSVTAL
jgi:hypothetical protein